MPKETSSVHQHSSAPGAPETARASSGRSRRTALIALPILFIALLCYLMRPPSAPPASAGISSAASPTNDSIAWRSDLAAAFAESRQLGKRVLVDFSASWCPPCQAMKRDVWPDPQVIQLAGRDFIPVLLDVDQAQGQNAGRRYGVESIPTILVLDSDGRVLRQAAFMSRDELVEFLRKAAKSG